MDKNATGQTKPFHAIDISLAEVKSSEVTYIRLDGDSFNSLDKKIREGGVVGFAWTGTPEFGVITAEAK